MEHLETPQKHFTDTRLQDIVPENTARTHKALKKSQLIARMKSKIEMTATI